MSLFSSIQVSASGMAAQRTRAEMLVENMANTETTRTPEGGPYRRKDVVFTSDLQSSPFSAVFQNELAEGVRVAEVVQDQQPPDMRYVPGHPDADANGMVRMPNVDTAREMVNLLVASRAYEANVAALQASRKVAEASLNLAR